MLFHIQELSSLAVIDPLGDIHNIMFDAAFGQGVNPDDPFEKYYDVNQGDDMIESLATVIRNDFRPQPEECFTTCIYQVDELEPFSCNGSSVKQLSVYKMMMVGLQHVSVIIKVDIISPAPFAVALLDTVCTVDESVGVMNVCVSLTHPVTDILDESVNVYVINYSSSIYIPFGAQLASEAL